MVTANPNGFAYRIVAGASGNNVVQNNRIVSLDSDGFTVDDNGETKRQIQMGKFTTTQRGAKSTFSLEVVKSTTIILYIDPGRLRLRTASVDLCSSTGGLGSGFNLR